MFTTKKWEKIASYNGIEIHLPGLESRNSIGVGERYHGPLQKILKTDRAENITADPEIVWRDVIKGINDTMGADVLLPTTLVHGCFLSFLELETANPTPAHQNARIRQTREGINC